MASPGQTIQRGWLILGAGLLCGSALAEPHWPNLLRTRWETRNSLPMTVALTDSTGQTGETQATLHLDLGRRGWIPTLMERSRNASTTVAFTGLGLLAGGSALVGDYSLLPGPQWPRTLGGLTVCAVAACVGAVSLVDALVGELAPRPERLRLVTADGRPLPFHPTDADHTNLRTLLWSDAPFFRQMNHGGGRVTRLSVALSAEGQPTQILAHLESADPNGSTTTEVPLSQLRSLSAPAHEACLRLWTEFSTKR